MRIIDYINESINEAERLLREYPYLTVLDNTNDKKTMVKNLRTYLKKTYPKIKFSVKEDRGGMLETFRITYKDGNITTEELDKDLEKWHNSDYDVMRDIRTGTISKFNEMFGGFDIILTERTITNDAIKSKVPEVLKDYPKLETGVDYDLNSELFTSGDKDYFILQKDRPTYKGSTISVEDIARWRIEKGM